jgi:hypothetical protein
MLFGHYMLVNQETIAKETESYGLGKNCEGFLASF